MLKYSFTWKRSCICGACRFRTYAQLGNNQLFAGGAVVSCYMQCVCRASVSAKVPGPSRPRQLDILLRCPADSKTVSTASPWPHFGVTSLRLDLVGSKEAPRLRRAGEVPLPFDASVILTERRAVNESMWLLWQIYFRHMRLIRLSYQPAT